MGIFDRFPYSSTHEMNLDFMLGKATEIAESLQEIDTHKEQAEQAATNAAQSATNAAQAAQAAAGSQTAAGTSASQAAQHKADAEDAADRAEAASDLADEAVEQAQAAAQTAGTAAQNASTAADGAIASAAAAETRINNLAASLPEDFTELNNEVTDLRSAIITEEITSAKTTTLTPGVTANRYIKSNGDRDSTDDADATDFTPVPQNTAITITNAYIKGSRSICAYSGTSWQSDFISCLATGGTSNDTETLTLTTPPNTAYIRATTKHGYTLTVSYTQPAENGSKIKQLFKNFDNDFGGKSLHVSLDDVWAPLYALKTTSPTSIFDIAEFAWLKTQHDTYGAKFTLNCFNQYTDQPLYDIKTLPSTYATEFQANKSWLRFAFHAKDEDTNYSTATTAAEDYADFVVGIYNLTGDYGCIDRFARLGFFGCTLTQAKALRDAEHGIKGFLCADDTRLSYYLSQADNDIVYQKGKMFDTDNWLYFIKTLPRLDSNSVETEVAEINKDVRRNKYVEVFIHMRDFTSSMNTRLGNMLSWAVDNGYTFNFAMDILD